MGGAIGAVLGGFDGFLYALIVFVVVDYITGLMAAVINKEVSSEVGFHGIVKSRDFLSGSSRAYRGHTDYL